MLLAGGVYDSITSPAILEELEEVLARPSFGADPIRVRLWMDAFVRASRQVFPEAIPGENAGAVRGDRDDLSILKTAYAAATGDDLTQVLAAARGDAGCCLVSENTRHFTPGRNVYGWRFITADAFLHILHARSRQH